LSHFHWHGGFLPGAPKPRWSIGEPVASAVQQPEEKRQDYTNDQAGHDREIKADIAALDHNIARQPTKPEFAQ
jgi:hypothetical protein